MDPFDPTSKQVARLNAHADKVRKEIRPILEGLPPEQRVAIYKACARGELTTFDPKAQRLIGLLAVLAIHMIAQDQD